MTGVSDLARCAGVEPGIPLELGLASQLLVVATAYLIKPLCMALNAWYLVRFRTVRSVELRLARAALVAFLVGETACAVNYLVFGAGYTAVQALHDLGMVTTFAWLTRAGLEAFERGREREAVEVGAPVDRCRDYPVIGWRAFRRLRGAVFPVVAFGRPRWVAVWSPRCMRPIVLKMPGELARESHRGDSGQSWRRWYRGLEPPGSGGMAAHAGPPPGTPGNGSRQHLARRLLGTG